MIRRKDLNAEASRKAILDAARTAFARRGFASTSLEDIVGPAGLTKGALYHHFTNKASLFEALYVEMEEELVESVVCAVDQVQHPEARVVAAIDAFLEASSEPAYVRIVLQEAPTILGQARGRELDHRIGLGLAESLVRELVVGAEATDLTVALTARILLAAVSEVAVTMSNSDDPTRVRDEGRAIVLALLGGFLAEVSNRSAAE